MKGVGAKQGTQGGFFRLPRLLRDRRGGEVPPPERAENALICAILARVENTSAHTLAELHVLGERFFTLERPWLNNKPNVSCIPLGIYKATYLARSASGKYKRVYWIRNVPGRVGCLTHAGNLVRHTRGCVLLGKRAGYLGGERAVLNSKTALHEFVELLGKQTIQLTITRG